MRKMFGWSAIAVALIVTPAVAGSAANEPLRVGDRVGALKGGTRSFVPADRLLTFIGFLAVGTGIMVYVSNQDSDKPASP